MVVAKTKMRSDVCIGGITNNGESVRIVRSDRIQRYNIGEVWEMEVRHTENRRPPHLEDIEVTRSEFLGTASTTRIIRVIERWMPPINEITGLFEGHLASTASGSLYISERRGVPGFSTTFWRPDEDLTVQQDGPRIRYLYSGVDGVYSLPFVGFQQPLQTVPAGALVRVSLARWWRGVDHDIEERCYAQLSGWFFEHR